MADRGADRPAPRPPRRRPIRRSRACSPARRRPRRCPEHRPSAVLLNRLWPLLVFTLLSGGLAFLAPQIPGIATGLRASSGRSPGAARTPPWRRSRSATGPPSTCAAPRRCGRSRSMRTPGFKAIRGRTRERRRHLRCRARRGARGAARLARLHRRAAPRRRASCEDSLRRAGRAVALASRRRPPRARDADAHRPRAGRAPRAGPRSRLLAGGRATAARDHLLEHHRRAAVAAPRRDPLRRDRGANRPGRHGLWQRPLERRRLAAAPLLLPWSEGALAGGRPADARPRARARRARRGRALGRRPAPRDIAAVTYAANPRKKGLDRVLAAWRELRRDERCRGEELLVAGGEHDGLARAGLAIAPGEGVRVLGELAPRAVPRAAAPRARVRVRAAPRGLRDRPARGARGRLPAREHAAPGPYAALPIARAPRRAPRGRGPRSGAAPQRSTSRCRDYAERALAALAPFRRAAVDRARRRAATAAPSCRAALSSANGRVLATSSRRQPRAPRGRDPPAHVRERAHAVGVGVDHDHHAGPRRRARVHVGEVAAVGVGVDLEHRARSARPPRTRPRGRPRRARGARSAGRWGGRSRRRAGARSPRCMRSVIACSPIAKEVCTLAITQSSSREQLVLVVERAVGQDVHLAAREQLDPLDPRVGLAHELDLALAAARGRPSLPKPWLAEWSVIARYS